MKRICCALLAALMLLTGCAGLAEGTENGFIETAQAVISGVNYVFESSIGVEQLFSEAQEVTPGSVYAFPSEISGMTAVMFADEVAAAPGVCMLMTDYQEELQLMLNAVCSLPLSMHMVFPQANDDGEWMNDVTAMANWLTAHKAAAETAMTAHTAMAERYTDAADYYLEFLVVPLEEGSRAVVNFFFTPYSGEQTETEGN